MVRLLIVQKPLGVYLGYVILPGAEKVPGYLIYPSLGRL